MRSTIDLWMTRLGYFYIVFPFLLFTSLWLNTIAAIVFSGIILVSFVFAVRLIDPEQFILISRKTVFWTLVTVLGLIFFSGIGTYTYQNDDHLYRNGMFRDLVNYPWPVMYKVEGFGDHFLEGKTTMMTYYLGYYLPAALVGKWFGFEAGKFALYLWSVLGMLLALYFTGKFLKKFNYKVVLLFLSWGSLFFIGALIKYPLEKFGEEGYYLWAGMRLYPSSNLGSVYWVFNQSLTAWTIMLIILNNINPRNILFLHSFALFLSPFCFVGFIPFTLYIMWKEKHKFRSALDWLKSFLSFQNIVGSLAVVLLTYLYLATNQAGQKFHYIAFPGIKIFVAFMVLSWGILAFLLFPKYAKEPLYWISILVIIPLPFFQQGNGIDFPGRVAMPAFLVLMLLAGKMLIEEKRGLFRWALVVYLFVSGVVHSFIEVGQSVYKTAYANLSYKTNLDQVLQDSDNPKLKEIGKDLESIKDKDVLTKDQYGTILNPQNNVIWNYMADTEHSLFYRYLAKKQD